MNARSYSFFWVTLWVFSKIVWTLDLGEAKYSFMISVNSVDVIVNTFVQKKASRIPTQSPDSFLKVWDPDIGSKYISQEFPSSHTKEALGPWMLFSVLEPQAPRAAQVGTLYQGAATAQRGWGTLHSNDKNKDPMKSFSSSS